MHISNPVLHALLSTLWYSTLSHIIKLRVPFTTFLYSEFYPYSPHTFNIMGIFESWSVLAVTYSPAHCQLTGICTYTHIQHDPPGPCSPGGSEGNYIMFASATDGSLPNNRQFSQCSRESMGQTIDVRGTCFIASELRMHHWYLELSYFPQLSYARLSHTEGNVPYTIISGVKGHIQIMI